jgi:hypothetical protein
VHVCFIANVPLLLKQPFVTVYDPFKCREPVYVAVTEVGQRTPAEFPRTPFPASDRPFNKKLAGVMNGKDPKINVRLPPTAFRY